MLKLFNGFHESAIVKQAHHCRKQKATLPRCERTIQLINIDIVLPNFQSVFFNAPARHDPRIKRGIRYAMID